MPGRPMTEEQKRKKREKDAATQPSYVNKSSSQSMLFVFRYGLGNIFFLHFSLVSIQV